MYTADRPYTSHSVADLAITNRVCCGLWARRIGRLVPLNINDDAVDNDEAHQALSPGVAEPEPEGASTLSVTPVLTAAEPDQVERAAPSVTTNTDDARKDPRQGFLQETCENCLADRDGANRVWAWGGAHVHAVRWTIRTPMLR